MQNYDELLKIPTYLHNLANLMKSHGYVSSMVNNYELKSGKVLGEPELKRMEPSFFQNYQSKPENFFNKIEASADPKTEMKEFSDLEYITSEYVEPKLNSLAIVILPPEISMLKNGILNGFMKPFQLLGNRVVQG